MHTLGLALALFGMHSAWIPGWGWVGVALAFAGCLLGLRSVSDRESRLPAMVLGTCATVFGGLGLLFGLGVQIKHAAPALDGLLAPLTWRQSALAAAGAALLLASALLLARFKVRRAGLALAFAFFLALQFCASSALVHADREMDRTASAGE
ncbi:MAG TPA: hypothetical protein VM389_09700 [Phycisphaerae bacterium]|nr:hypothetical protein [Phycisphaerae bacterium]